MEPVRFGLVGYGFGGRCSTLRCWHRRRSGAFWRRHPLRRAARRADSRPSGTRPFDSLADLAAAGVDAVAISTPGRHARPAHPGGGRARAARRGATSRSRSTPAPARVVERADRLGVPLTVYQNRRWDSDLRTLRQADRRGALGAVRGSSRGSSGGCPSRAPAPGRRPLLDLAPPGRPGAGAVRPGRPVYAEAVPRSASRTTTSSWRCTTERARLAPVGAAAPGRPWPAFPGHRLHRHLPRRRHRRTARRPRCWPGAAGDDRRPLGRRARSTGDGFTTARRAPRSRRARPLGHLLSRVRQGGPGGRHAAGRPLGMRSPPWRVLDAARRSATERVVVPLGQAGTGSARPFASRTTSTISPMMSVSPKSFGVNTSGHALLAQPRARRRRG